jgi:hypothetical protein
VLNAVPTTGGTFSGNVLFASGNGIWNTSGNVGIGTSSPGYKLQVNRTGNGAAARFTNGSTIIDLWNDSTSSYIGDAGAVNALEVNTASNSATLNTNNSQRLLIDSAGRVTTPFQPCFHVRLNSGTYLTTSPLPFTNAVFDVGSNFNTSTYRFTAPVAGKYGFLFNGYFRFNANNENGAFGFRVNASNRQYAEFTIVTATIYASPCMTAIFDLGVGDYVDVRFSGNADYYGGNEETNFYGWLIG